MILARRPFSFTRECETSVSREVRDDATLREVEVPVEGSKDVCEAGVHCWRRMTKRTEALKLQDIMTKYNEVNLVWNTDHYRDGGAREPDGSCCTGSCTVVRCATNLEELMITNFLEHDDVQCMKRMTP